MTKRGEMMVNAPAENAISVARTGEMLGQMCELMRGMAETIRATNERMDRLEHQIAMLTPVTAAQSKAISDAMKQRAIELATQYGLPDAAVRDIVTAIRRAVKLDAGVRSVNELARTLYGVYMEQIGYWDDFGAMKTIRAKYAKGGRR